MSEVIGKDTWEGRVTRIYVWYPDEPVSGVLPDWERDPVIADYLNEIRRSDDRATIDAHRYYHNPKPTGQVIVIARLVD